MIKRIAITGPESTGKSTLTRQLAESFQTTWVPEYAREYLTGIQRPYTYQDILKIAHGQFNLEQQIEPLAHHFLFCDTDFIVLKIWCIDKFKKCPPWIQRKAEIHRYDLYLLTDIDFPWSHDPLREDPHRREFLLGKYQEELETGHYPYRIVSGLDNERLLNAIRIINDFFGYYLHSR
jgi:NadR type nicotinamide-nucleotide adenylyltransferase